MKVATSLPYRRHIFVCVNEREEKSCCKNVNGYETFIELKKFVIENGLVNDVWVTKSGCLGFCNDIGCTIVMYPEKVWFLQSTAEDVKKIKEQIIKDLK